MASRRMISMKICGSVDFFNLPMASRSLYFHCVMFSDDDGVTDARMVMKLGGYRKRDLDRLIDDGYLRLINANKLAVWVVNWQSFNTVKKGRGTPSIYREDLLRSLPDIKNALFTPKTEDIWQTSDVPELELELEESRTDIESESELESEINNKQHGSSFPTYKMLNRQHPNDFFTELYPDEGALQPYVSDWMNRYGSEYMRYLNAVATKILRMEVWCPETCASMAEKFMELNGIGITQKWKTNKWIDMLEGFVKNEKREPDYDEWCDEEDADDDDGNELPFS